MLSPEERKELNAISEKVIGCAFKVGGKLGCGFLEKVYENAMAFEMGKAGLDIERQVKLEVKYENIIVGEFTADLLAEGKILVELKAASKLNDIHMAQCMNYLKATGHKICLLINFGRPKVEVRRIANKF